MVNGSLLDFIATNRDEIILRCRGKVAERETPLHTEAEVSHGVPVFLDQLCEELRWGRANSPGRHQNTSEIGKSAMQHGHDLLLQGFTISQVVHDYGDVCQSVTDLAVEMTAPITPDDFRTLNRCLDDAIAGAVTEYVYNQDVTRYGATQQLQILADRAITAFEVVRAGRVGVGGSTGAVVLQSLMALRAALVDRPPR